MSLLVAPLVLAESEEGTDASRCPALTFMPGIGDVCPREDGIEVYAPDGRSLGFSHGPDPVCVDCPLPEPVASGGTTPYCVAGTPGEHYVQFIFARASDDSDRYASLVGSLRNVIGQANKMVDDAAIATGSRTDIKIKCVDGAVAIPHEVLPRARSSTTFATIVSDLQARGYDNDRVKYWIYYDDTTGCSGCAGMGERYSDDRNIQDNLNNGAPLSAPMYAVSFGYADVRTLLHELGHTLGAVQNSAPHTTNAGHCIDGRDTMCYNDGGSRGSSYSTGVCAVEVFDCGKDDYFHTNPPSGSYLATHWNLAHLGSRYLKRPNDASPPSLDPITCPGSVSADSVATCTFRATDDNAGVTYTVQWGDGATSVLPSSGTFAPNVTRAASHVYTAGGSMLVRVKATDSGSPPRSSVERTATIVVSTSNPPPVMGDVLCAPALEDEPATCTFSATDDNAVAYTVRWGDGVQQRVPLTGYTAANATQQATRTFTAGGTYVVEVSAVDNGSPPSFSLPRQTNLTITAVNDAPVLASLSCTANALPAETVACSFRATDEDSAGVRYRVEWGDGAVTDVPASGTLAPGATASASRAYGVEGNFTITVRATDAEGAGSNARNATVTVAYDREAPTVRMDVPKPGVYYGCTGVASAARERPLFVMRGCVDLEAEDEAGVAYVEVRYAGRWITRMTSPPYQFSWDVPRANSGALLVVTVVDGFGNARVIETRVDTV